MQNLLLSISNYILTITINRPDKLNALNKATIQDLHDALKLHATDAEVKVVVITGAGTKAFVAGADILIRNKVHHSVPKVINYFLIMLKIITNL